MSSRRPDLLLCLYLYPLALPSFTPSLSHYNHMSEQIKKGAGIIKAAVGSAGRISPVNGLGHQVNGEWTIAFMVSLLACGFVLLLSIAWLMSMGCEVCFQMWLL